MLHFRLQKFKINIANSVISSENASLASMATDQLLDLFSLDDDSSKDAASSSRAQQPEKKGMKAILDSMGELWDESQYEKEYDLGNFMQSLSK